MVDITNAKVSLRKNITCGMNEYVKVIHVFKYSAMLKEQICILDVEPAKLNVSKLSQSISGVNQLNQ